MITEWLVGAAMLSAASGAMVQSAGARAVSDTVPAQERLTAEEVVESAVRTHPGVVGARARQAALAAEAGQARSSLRPTVSVLGTATRYEEPMVVAPLHGFDLRSPPAFDETLYQGHARAGYTLFDGGARRSRVRAAESRVTAAESVVAAVRDGVIAEAITAYLAVLTGREVASAHGRMVAALDAERSRTELLLSEGKAPRVAVLRAEAALSEARAAEEAASEDLRLAVHRLVRVSGLDPARVRADALVDIRLTDTSVPGREALLAAALEANPRLAESRDRVAAAELGVAAARGAFLPTVELSGGYSAFGGASTDPVLEWQGGVQVSYPIYAGGARSRGVERARALAEAAVEEARMAERSVEDAVDAALMGYRSASARVEALEAAVAQSEEVSRIEALALASGAGVQTDYLRAEASLLRARAALADARYAMVEARVRLAQATGQLDEDWLDPWTEGEE